MEVTAPIQCVESKCLISKSFIEFHTVQKESYTVGNLCFVSCDECLLLDCTNNYNNLKSIFCEWCCSSVFIFTFILLTHITHAHCSSGQPPGPTLGQLRPQASLPGEAHQQTPGSTGKESLRLTTWSINDQTSEHENIWVDLVVFKW